MNFGKPDVIILQKTFFIFSVYFFIIFYFYPYEEGISFAPEPLRLLKEFFFIFVTAISGLSFGVKYLSFSIKKNYIWSLFLLLILITSLLNYFITRDHSNLISSIKVALYSLVVYFWSEEIFIHFSKRKDFYLLSQFFISVSALFFGFTLWEGGDFVGSLANPNTFGLFSNIIFFMLLSSQYIRKYDFILLIIALICVFYSRSLSQQLIFFSLFALNISYFLYRKRYQRLCFSFFLLFVSVLIVVYTDTVNSYLVDSLARYLDLTDFSQGSSVRPVSLSVSGRTKNFMELSQLLSDSSISQLLLGAYNRGFFFSDCQYFVILANYGILGLVLFLFFLLKAVIKTLKEFPERITNFTVLLAFLLTFIFTKFLDYFPMNIIFYLFLVFVMKDQDEKCLKQ